LLAAVRSPAVGSLAAVAVVPAVLVLMALTQTSMVIQMEQYRRAVLVFSPLLLGLRNITPVAALELGTPAVQNRRVVWAGAGKAAALTALTMLVLMVKLTQAAEAGAELAAELADLA
jgi:hypothetical protein